VEGCERHLNCGVRIVSLKGDFLHQGLSKCLPLNAQEQALLPLHVTGVECNVIYITDAVVHMRLEVWHHSLLTTALLANTCRLYPEYLHNQLVRLNYLAEAFIRDGVHGGTVIQNDLWWLPQDLTGVEN